MNSEYFETDGVALRGHDPVAYFTEHKAVKGSAEYAAEFEGSTFHFASRVNRDAFVADPAKFAPQYGGFCAFGLARGYKATTDPSAFSVVDGKLYLNHSPEVQARWGADVAGFVTQADANWPAVRAQTEVLG